MRGVDQRLEVVGRAVGGIRREQQHAVIAPVPSPGEIGDRHQLDRGEAGVDQVIEPVDGGAERPLRRETCRHAASRMTASCHGRPRQSARLPVIGMVDHLARPADVVGLERAGRIGHLDLAVDPKSVAQAGARGGTLEARTSRPSRRRMVSVSLHDEVDRARRRRPQPERDAIATSRRGPNRTRRRHGDAREHRDRSGRAPMLLVPTCQLGRHPASACRWSSRQRPPRCSRAIPASRTRSRPRRR